MSFLTLYQASRPDASLWTHTTVQFSLPYFSVSISLNILLTLLLVGRLFYMSERAKRAIGREHAATYSSIASMLIESAVPYAVTGLIFIITYARNSNVQNLVLPVLGQIMVRTPSPFPYTVYQTPLTLPYLRAVYLARGHHLARGDGPRCDRQDVPEYTGTHVRDEHEVPLAPDAAGHVPAFDHAWHGWYDERFHAVLVQVRSCARRRLRVCRW